MGAYVVIVGQLRTPGLLVRMVEDACALAEKGAGGEIILSTWTTELERLPWLTDLLLRRGVRLVASQPIAVDTYRNYRRQQHLLDKALDGVADTELVVKLRPDWVVSRENLAVLCKPPAPPGVHGGSEVVRGKVRLPWWTTRVPFHLADESMAGYAADIRRFNPADARLALADPHAGRYMPHLLELMPVLRFADEHIFSYIAEAQPDPPDVVEALGGPRRSAAEGDTDQQIGPYPFDIATMALDLPSYQRAMACYLASVGNFFDIHNPTPDKDQFIERKGPWSYTTTDVHTVGDPLRSPDPVCYLPERLARVAKRRPGEFITFRRSVREYREEPTLLLAPADEEQYLRDAAELRRRVDAFRLDRLRLASSPRATVPGSMRRAPLFKTLGPAFDELGSIYEHAEARCPANTWAYLSARPAAGTQVGDTRECPLGLRDGQPASCADAAAAETSTTFLGIELTAPVLTAPIGRDPWLHPDDRRAVVRAAAACGLASVIAETTYWSFDAAAAESDGPKLMQLHMHGAPEAFGAQARRAEEAGFAALCATLNSCPPFDKRDRRVWDALARAAADLSIPLIVAGPLTTDDVEQAIAVGAAGVLVSSRGDGPPGGTSATPARLSEVVSAARGRLAIAADSGIRHGRNILETLTLGTDVVLVDWPLIAGLSAAGEHGARKVLELLNSELRRSMLLAGCGCLAEIDSDAIPRGRTPG